MRRTSIYLHRSVRSLPMTRSRLAAGLATAGVFSLVVRALASRLLTTHEQICDLLLRVAGIPILGHTTVSVFSTFGVTTIPVTPSPNIGMGVSQVMTFAIAVLVLLVVYRFVPLARNFVAFVSILLAVSAATFWFIPSLPLDSATFSLIWLRGEVLVWLVLPSVTATLFVPIQSWSKAWAWMLGVQIFGFFWSAVRLTFCLGVLEATGTIFLPVLWFCLGVLADFLYLVVAYSIAVHYAASVWGKRRLWQY